MKGKVGRPTGSPEGVVGDRPPTHHCLCDPGRAMARRKFSKAEWAVARRVTAPAEVAAEMGHTLEIGRPHEDRRFWIECACGWSTAVGDGRHMPKTARAVAVARAIEHCREVVDLGDVLDSALEDFSGVSQPPKAECVKPAL